MYIRCLLPLSLAILRLFLSFIRGEMLQYLPMCAYEHSAIHNCILNNNHIM